MEWKPFEVTEYNDVLEDKIVIMNSERGRIWVKVGTVDICITQSDDGLGVVIDAYDAEVAGDPIDSMAVWYNDETFED